MGWLVGVLLLPLAAASGCGAGGGVGPLEGRDGLSSDPGPEHAPAETADDSLAVRLSPQELRRTLTHSPLPPVPDDPTNSVFRDPRAQALGRALFYDEGLSVDGSVSCATCHVPEESWTDGRVTGRGLSDVTRNTPSLWNVAYNRWLFWDGRSDSLWAQALGPLEDPREHGGSRLQYVHYLAGEPALRDAYEALFGPLPDVSDARRFPAQGRPVRDDREHPHQRAWDGMSAADQLVVDRVFADMGKALGAFVGTIVSDRAPFDVFVEGLRDGDAGKLSALSPSAQRGLQLFMGDGNCHLCHTGPNFTDMEFHDIRVPPADGMPIDPGRSVGILQLLSDPFNGVGAFSDDPAGAGELRVGYLKTDHLAPGEFKTPSLRNVTRTAPYMHQGQMVDLDAVLHYYSTLEGAIDSRHPEKILVPLDLSDRQKQDLAAFLAALTDDDVAPELTPPPVTPSRSSQPLGSR